MRGRRDGEDRVYERREEWTRGQHERDYRRRRERYRRKMARVWRLQVRYGSMFRRRRQADNNEAKNREVSANRRHSVRSEISIVTSQPVHGVREIHRVRERDARITKARRRQQRDGASSGRDAHEALTPTILLRRTSVTLRGHVVALF